MFPCGPGFFGGVSTPGDSYWSDVIALLHFDGANGSTTFTDSKGVLSWTAYGAAVLSSAQYKFGGTSGYFYGSGARANSSLSEALSPLTGDFAIEFWWRPNSGAPSGYKTIFVGSTAGDLALQSASPTNNALVFYGDGSTATITESSAPTSDVWHFYKLSRYGNTVSMTRDGTVTATTTVSGSTSYKIVSSANIGTGTGGGAGYVINSWIDDFRITFGTSRPGSSVPTAAFPNHG